MDRLTPISRRSQNRKELAGNPRCVSALIGNARSNELCHANRMIKAEARAIAAHHFTGQLLTANYKRSLAALSSGQLVQLGSNHISELLPGWRLHARNPLDSDIVSNNQIDDFRSQAAGTSSDPAVRVTEITLMSSSCPKSWAVVATSAAE
jgi:hypothetical protein